jgi:ribose transport system permease protein
VSEKEDEMEKGKGSTASVQFLVKFGIFPILLVIFIVFAILSPEKFLSGDNIVNIFRAGAINMVVAIGMTLVLLTGGIDLSVGSIVAVSAVVALQISLVSFSFLDVPIAIIVGGVIGLLNGVIVAYLGVPAFIVTLGSMTSLRGVAYLLAGGNSIINNELNYSWIGNSSLGAIPWLVIIALLLVFGFDYLTKHTTYGRKVYAVGGNPTAAHFTGIKVKRILLSVYVLSGCCAGMAGVMVSSRLFAANGLVGTQYELDAIASSIIGGTSFTGGKGTILGTLLGALVIAMLTNGLTIQGVGYYWQQVARGLVIIGALILDIYRNKLIERMKLN